MGNFGKLISFEGVDGGGKSSQIELLKDHLSSLGIDTIVTREPGGTSLSENIRDILLSPESKIGDMAELYLYLAARAQLIEEVIEPALKLGKWVLSDRFIDSTFAYQGYGRGLDLDNLKEANRIATGGLVPDVTILLDIDVKVGKERVGGRGLLDRLEQNSLDFFNRVRDGFLEMSKLDENRYLVTDASNDILQVKNDIFHQLNDRGII